MADQRDEQLVQRAVRIPTDGVWLEGDLALPAGARGVVAFAHGSGSSRFSGRNRAVAAELRRGGLGTLLMDLLTADEEYADRDGANLRFDIDLLARRVVDAIDWLAEFEDTRSLHLGLFGASTGAAAALVAAAERPENAGAIVSRGGRVDLAVDALERVEAPTLLIVGGHDDTVLELNRIALTELPSESHLVIVPGASHLFEELGALEQVASLARQWFVRWLVGETTAQPPAMR